ncbi:MAG: efflux RND transporter periplasmic adaptor subunit, partial [Anaerolineales bacterium]
MPSAKKHISLLLLAVFVLSACRGQSRGSATPTPVPTPIVLEKPTYTVQAGTVTKALELTGRVAPVQQQELFFRADGFVRAVYFARGDQVKAGDVLAELENLGALEGQLAAAQLALQRAEINLENARLELELFILQTPGAELRQAQAAVKVAEAERAVVQAQRAYQSTLSTASQTTIDAAYAQMLLAENALTQAQKRFEPYTDKPEDNLTRAQLLSQLSAAQQAYDAAVRNYNGLTAPGAPANQALAAAQLQLAQAQLAQAQQELAEINLDPNALGRAQELGLKQNAVALAQIALEETRLDVADLENALAEAQIAAPFDGQILSLGLAPGSQATAYRAVITLADPAALEIMIMPSPEEAREISMGQTVTLQFTNRPGETAAGQVRSLPFLAGSPAGANDQTTNDPSARITVDDPALALTLGETVMVTIRIAARENVLWLPPAALRTFQGSDFVLVQNGDL